MGAVAEASERTLEITLFSQSNMLQFFILVCSIFAEISHRRQKGTTFLQRSSCSFDFVSFGPDLYTIRVAVHSSFANKQWIFNQRANEKLRPSSWIVSLSRKTPMRGFSAGHLATEPFGLKPVKHHASE
jgi:hypothetical protein